MSLIDRLRDCNNANLRTVRPLLHEGATIGWVDPDFACRLTAKPDVFSVCRDKIIIASSGLGYRALSDKINLALREVYDDDQSGFGKWCNERSPGAAQIGHAPLFEV